MVNAELRLGRTNDAVNLLRAKTKAQPNETIWWDLLARAYDQDKKIGLRHYALAEKFATEGAWPSAIEQLKTVTAQAGAEWFPSTPDQNPVDIGRAALDYAKKHLFVVLLVDTAGRLAFDDSLMA